MSFDPINYTVIEGGVIEVFLTVNNTDYDFPFTVNLSYVDGTAIRMVDFDILTTKVDFERNQTNASFFVLTMDDIIPEPDETFSVSISGVSHSVLAGVDSAAQITILNDDGTCLFREHL